MTKILVSTTIILKKGNVKKLVKIIVVFSKRVAMFIRLLYYSKDIAVSLL
ncbi:hypothetical protein HMPREF3293_01460 [Christensenella minuta]|uniref:Uncharacterized protein n=1 Tax=Christensenella minuta TaxID=626937 RepID=A0A136Q4X2_9FIRM|nr:hypothetical protein HMPREF3293_01460 [Christensenella minuta]